MPSPSVPRASDFTGHQSPDERAADREWLRARRDFRENTSKNGFATQPGKANWRRLTQRTRSF